MPGRKVFLGALLMLLIAGGAAPARAAGVVILANGGSYFHPSGPAQYWRYDWYQGYCGKVSAWCQPRHAQWTYAVRQFGATNSARWVNPFVVDYPNRAHAFIPYRNATATVDYNVHYNHVSGGIATVDQNRYSDQWAPLVTAAGHDLYRIDGVYLGDNTWYGTGSDKVSFDEIKIEN